MSDVMTPIPFADLMNRLLEERSKYGSCFGLRTFYRADGEHFFSLFGRKLETQIGPAAGPNTQLAQNIIAAYCGGSRFFELKTVQKIDGSELSAAVNKPCILAEDEGYNCEWSTELTVQQAFDEYVKAWFALKVIAKEWELGASDGFQFNISVGYDLEGIKGEKVNAFIDGMINAESTTIFRECREWLSHNIGRFSRFSLSDLNAVTPDIVNSVTVSTLHGCPPQEIEAIASYLITQKHLHTFIKCNPTLLGYDEARKTLDAMGYDYVHFTDVHFRGDLQYSDAVPMLERLQTLSNNLGLLFGVKISNTFPVDVTRNELPSSEMYMSGKSLYPLSLKVARNLSRSFGGKLRISFSGGCDYFNIKNVIDAGVWPVTMATTLLKPGGYARLVQIAEMLGESEAKAWDSVNVPALEKLAEESTSLRHHVKPIKPLPSRKSSQKVPLLDCFTAPCSDRCPIHQDITKYGQLVAEGRYSDALRVILAKNPLPFITGNICTHTCQSACSRNHYETPVQIRSNKIIAARKGYAEVLPQLKHGNHNGRKIAIIGAGPAGISAAYFLAREGCDVTVYDENEKAGGLVQNIIPAFRISEEEIQKDVALAEAVGANFVLGRRIENVDELKADAIILAVGAHKTAPLPLDGGMPVNALDFLAEFKRKAGHLSLGENVAVVGGGNTAMDTARAAKRTNGVRNVYLVYRRTRRYMPADEEELDDAIRDGVEFRELLSPVAHKGGELLCRKMALSEQDSSGRRSVKETDELVKIPCSTVIASIGEKVDGEFYRKNGIEINADGLPVVDPETCETSRKNVYAIGDGAFGASVVVKAIADAQRASSAILGQSAPANVSAELSDGEIYSKRGLLAETPEEGCPDNRCLSCELICENCAEACPNRANIAITIKGRKMHQIIHVDYMCNECGNCSAFCPYNSAPYREKFTLFASESDLAKSDNDGFVFLNESGDAVVRVGGRMIDYCVGGENSELDAGLAEIIDTVFTNYKFLVL